MLLLVSCTKTEQIQPVENKPMLIQIEAVYIDGNTDLSPVVVTR